MDRDHQAKRNRSRKVDRPWKLEKRWLIGVPIVVFWSVMTGLLLYGELSVQRLPAGGQRLNEPSDSWLGVFATGGQRVGHIHLRQAPEERGGQPGARMSLEARVHLVLLGKESDLDLAGTVWRPDGIPRVEFDFNVRSAGFDFAVAGEVAEGWLESEMVSAGETLPLRLPVDDSLVFAGGLGSALHFPVLEVGEEYRLETFDPLTLSKGEARVKCTGREILELAGVEVAVRRLTVSMSGINSVAWIDDTGEVVRAQTPIGLTLERITAEEAAEATPVLTDLPGLLDQTAIRPTGKRPFRTARRMTVRLVGAPDRGLPEDRIQMSLGQDIYRIEIPPEPSLAAQSFATPALAPHLRADPFIQSDHVEIRDQAAAIVGEAPSAWRKSLQIHDWVFSRLDKEPVLSIPSALEVLKRRRGDCNEHTVLFTALARASSVPTRVAIGVVWSDELAGFYYHAWPEVFLDDWVWMDPTLDQPLADATHIKLASGGIETWPQLLPYLGQLEIEVLDVE